VCDEQRLEPSNVAVYICGQPAMAAAVEALLVARGFAKEQMRQEVY
jgi:NAD(P)H-flavin reductase